MDNQDEANELLELKQLDNLDRFLFDGSMIPLIVSEKLVSYENRTKPIGEFLGECGLEGNEQYLLNPAFLLSVLYMQVLGAVEFSRKDAVVLEKTREASSEFEREYIKSEVKSFIDLARNYFEPAEEMIKKDWRIDDFFYTHLRNAIAHMNVKFEMDEHGRLMNYYLWDEWTAKPKVSSAAKRSNKNRQNLRRNAKNPNTPEGEKVICDFKITSANLRLFIQEFDRKIRETCYTQTPDTARITLADLFS